MRRILIALSLASSLAAAPPTLLDQARSFLSSVWSDEGCRIDPDGKCAPSTEEGCHIDPDGGCAPRLDEGCMIDPSGRCLAPQADTGHHIDPDGRS